MKKNLNKTQLICQRIAGKVQYLYPNHTCPIIVVGYSGVKDKENQDLLIIHFLDKRYFPMIPDYFLNKDPWHSFDKEDDCVCASILGKKNLFYVDSQELMKHIYN